MSKKTKKEKTKPNFPDKMCPTCQRPFSWRKKWDRDWNNVIYCFKLCQKNKDRDLKD